MYTKEHFTLPNVREERAFVESRSFGVLTTHLGDKVFASPVPFDLREEGDGRLFVAGHIARANDMLEAFVSGNAAAITVIGADSFVPAEWFGVRSRIPTWIYSAVEISGRLEPVSDVTMAEDVNAMIARLQRQVIPESTWTLNEIDTDISREYLKYISGYRIYDLEIKSCCRLNQGMNHSPALVEHLRAYGTEASRQLADLVANPPTIRVSRLATD